MGWNSLILTNVVCSPPNKVYYFGTSKKLYTFLPARWENVFGIGCFLYCKPHVSEIPSAHVQEMQEMRDTYAIQARISPPNNGAATTSSFEIPSQFCLFNDLNYSTWWKLFVVFRGESIRKRAWFFSHWKRIKSTKLQQYHLFTPFSYLFGDFPGWVEDSEICPCLVALHLICSLWLDHSL